MELTKSFTFWPFYPRKRKLWYPPIDCVGLETGDEKNLLHLPCI